VWLTPHLRDPQPEGERERERRTRIKSVQGLVRQVGLGWVLGQSFFQSAG